MFSNLKSGNSIKMEIEVRGKVNEYKGIYVILHNNPCLLCDGNSSLVFNNIFEYYGFYNIIDLSKYSKEIKNIAATRLPSEVSSILKEEYDLIIKQISIEAEIKKLDADKRKNLESSRKLYTKLLDTSTPETNLDMKSIIIKINHDLKSIRSFRSSEHNFDCDISLSASNLEKKRGSSAQLELLISYSRSERLMSKESEDRYARGESAESFSKLDKYYVKTSYITNFLERNGFKQISEKKYTTGGEKGYVYFSTDIKYVVPFDLSNYSKSIEQLKVVLGKLA